MISLSRLNELRRALADTNVLSVYIAAEEHDPTQRSSWRARLDFQLDRLAASLSAGAEQEFAAARRHLEDQLAPYRGFLPGRGWAGVVTRDGIQHGAEVSAPMPDIVRWRRGPVLGPYLRALKQQRPVVVALVDSRRARVLRYEAGEISERVDYRADDFIDDLTDRNMSKRAHTHSGVRGETATDAAERTLQLERDRLLDRVIDTMEAEGAGALVVVGGPAETAAALQKQLEPVAGARLVVDPSLHLKMSLPDVKARIEVTASVLTQRLQLSDVEDVLERAGAGDRGVLGPVGSSTAAATGQVERLLVTTRFITDREEDAEKLIALVLDNAGAIDLVTGEAAALLDARAEGVAARLRFVRKPHSVTAAGGER